MSRKTNIASLIAVTAAATITFTIAGSSGAVAQVSPDQGTGNQDQSQSLTDEIVPQFVSHEVVQPLSNAGEPASDNAVAPATDNASSLKELVAEVPAPAKLSPEMECLAGAIYFESRGEPVAGQLAVAQVVVNRAESQEFPSDYCGVVYQRSQFSFVKSGRMPHIKRSSGAWKRAKVVARIAHEGLWQSRAGASLYFHAKYVNPKWSRKKVALATISSHVFYR